MPKCPARENETGFYQFPARDGDGPEPVAEARPLRRHPDQNSVLDDDVTNELVEGGPGVRDNGGRAFFSPHKWCCIFRSTTSSPPK